ncbi:glutaredoxin 3 [Magnetospirillum aberrantis]|uniref:Glutaredoxin n=1 Tax=Magnetospirillum aberrantis SpK TaxID=908842 RepID=A0A7C9QW83_9PROT|nr:glutaredoxin 3 [Magnetospirillum aberrantis]NFV81957.1 glutaredoxin 3 [Magnetospirillum aberrantis SpK]
MADIEIYTTLVCPYCVRAKRLFDKKGVTYREIDVSHDGGLREAMTARAGGRRTVPQIFIDGEHVGGCDDLYALDAQGGLDSKLGVDA